jgi:hypothetical protein
MLRYAYTPRDKSLKEHYHFLHCQAFENAFARKENFLHCSRRGAKTEEKRI